MRGSLSLRRALAALTLGSASVISCASETIDLLPPEASGGSEPMTPAGSSGALSGSSGAGGSLGGCDDCGGGSGGSFVGACPPGIPGCIPCDAKQQCGPRSLHCAPWLNYVCVECTMQEHCRPDFKCDVRVGRCAEACITSDDCHDADQLCDPREGLCVECVSPGDCNDDGSPQALCRNGRCLECEDLSDCVGERYKYCLEFQCLECRFDLECGDDQHCDDQRGECEQN